MTLKTKLGIIGSVAVVIGIITSSLWFVLLYHILKIVDAESWLWNLFYITVAGTIIGQFLKNWIDGIGKKNRKELRILAEELEIEQE